MKDRLTRRDFLKLAGLLPLSVATPGPADSIAPGHRSGGAQNVIIIVFDAFSAYNVSLYGYPRETTPHLDRLANRAVVYHNHYAGSNFTTPGTASLLTGALPWTHRALHVKEKTKKYFEQKNIFTAFENYYRIAYSHNRLVNVLEEQFKESLDELVPRDRLYLKRDFVVPTFLEGDEDIFTVSWIRGFDKRVDGLAYSLFLSYLNEAINERIDAKYAERFAKIKPQFPRGIPGRTYDNQFILEDAIDWLQSTLGTLPQPFLGYFHFYPPHAPYFTHRDFFGAFKGDGITQKLKPRDIFALSNRAEATRSEWENDRRMMYDEFILYVDREFGRLFDYLERAGLLENSWVILTSDHGEMFERGVIQHGSHVLYEPVIRIPLIIFEPGRQTRLDVHTQTSAIDILPTMLHVTGQPSADWTEGTVLPPYASMNPGKDRSVFVLEAQRNKSYAPLTIATTTLVKREYKLMYFFGYEELDGKERIELYDIDTDPEELNDLYDAKRATADEMLHELKSVLLEMDAYHR